MISKSTARIAALLTLLLLTCTSTVHACPVCDSPRAVEVRSGFAEDITPKTIAAIAMPFVVVAGVVSLVHFGLPNARRTP